MNKIAKATLELFQMDKPEDIEARVNLLSEAEAKKLLTYLVIATNKQRIDNAELLGFKRN